MTTCRNLLPVVFFCIYTGLSAQDFVYKAGFFGFFDNREYFNKYVNDLTIFGTRISGELGYTFNDNNRIMAGTDFLYEFGSKGELTAPDIIAYYHGSNRNAGIYLGAFPRMNLMTMPFALYTDTFQYYRTVMEGMLLEYRSGGFYHNAWIDWTGKQSLRKKETFLTGFSGYAKKGIVTWQHHFIMTHLAHSKNISIEEHIRDNGAITALPGLDLSGITPFDSLSVSAGILMSFDRLRNIYDFRYPAGFLGELNIGLRNFGLKGTLYAGERQIITSGDGFYQSDFYCRTDAFWQTNKHGITGKLLVSLHFIPGVTDVSMSFVLKASIEGIFRRHQFN